MNTSLKTMIIGMLLIIALPMAKLSAQISTWDGTWEPWTHGTGTEADPFLIENAQQLAYLAYRVNNGFDAGGSHVSNHDYHYKLMTDVNLNGSEDFQWTPIGYWNSNSDYQCFGGHFDGNDHKISGVYINSTANRVGFWGFVNGATIENLGVNGSLITTTGETAGGIIGVADGTNIIINCCNTGTVSSIYSGGIVGYVTGSVNITNCYNTENVYSSNPNNWYYSFSGGIVGYANTANITNCYNTGTMSSYSFPGGIVGYANMANITNCYNTGAVSSSYSSYCGGIVGGEDNGTVTNCYYLNTCGGNNNNGGQPMSADAMKTEEFVNNLNGDSETWTLDSYNVNQGYPIFSGVLYVNATTLSATTITQTHATLNGRVYTTGSIASSGFEYKETTDSNYQTITFSNGGNISHTLSGLVPDRQYVYRTFCTTTEGRTFYGKEKTFTTLPVSVTTYPATDVTSLSAVLHGFVGFWDATLVSKGFEYRKVGNPNYTTVNVAGNDNNYNAQVTGLTVNTTYEYRAFMNIAENATTYYGETRTFEVSWLNSDTICITNVDMLRWVSEQCNSGTTFQGKYIKLMNDITLPLNVPNNMTSIGVYPDYPFKGTFDGNGKHITNLYIDQPNTEYQGFFGYTLNANLYNVGLVNITASGRNYTGGMVAYAENTYLRDCYVNGGTLFALSYCGGLIGYQEQGTNSIVSGCYNTCEVSGNNYVGGLVGFSNYSTVRNSYVAAMVAAQGDAVGSIIGGANEVLMYYTYFNAELTGQTNAIGWNNTGGGKDGGEAMTSAQMRDPQFVATLNSGLTVHVWKQDYTMHINNGFPILQWQVSTGIEENGFIKAAVYPNPTNGKVTIKAEDLKQITISNMLGQIIYEGKASGNMFEYDFGEHGTGLYHIRIETANGIALKKVSMVR